MNFKIRRLFVSPTSNRLHSTVTSEETSYLNLAKTYSFYNLLIIIKSTDKSCHFLQISRISPSSDNNLTY